MTAASTGPRRTIRNGRRSRHGPTARRYRRPLSSAPLKARIIQTNSAGDDVHIIDPATNKVVGEIRGIEVGHGAAASPDGRWIYVSNEANSTLDVVDARTLRVTSSVPLTGHPNNISISRDGRRVYVAIRQAPGAVDVIDTPTLTRVKSIPIEGDVHNTYVTPDGRYVIAGSIAGKTATAIDQRTEEPVWVMHFDLGVRPMAFEQNADGSTKRMFVQLTELNGFAVIDFATHTEVARIELPKLAPGKEPVYVGGNASHGMIVSADNTRLVVDSRLNSAVYVYSLPDLEAPRRDRRGHRARLGDADAGRQDRLRRQRGLELRVGRRCRRHARDHAHSRGSGAETQYHGDAAVSSAIVTSAAIPPWRGAPAAPASCCVARSETCLFGFA